MIFKKKPRIIFNDDSVSLAIAPQPHTKEKISRAVDYLKGSQVDVLCWCVMEGDVASGYPSKVIENKYQFFFNQFPDTKAGQKLCRQALAKTKDLTLSLYAEGIDYLPTLIKLTQKTGIKFFGSFRMNDCHHKSQPLGSFSQDQGIYLISEFWKTHQDCRLWEVTDAKSYYNATMDYSFADVRNNRINAVMELASNYDVDGIELDFCRNPYTFPPSQAWSKRGILTDFIKKIRTGLNSIARARGREMGLIIRVPVMREKLINAGMDIEKWVKAKYMDVLVMSHLTNNYNLRVDDWLALCRRNGVLFYPSVEAGPADNAPAHNHVVPVKMDEVVKRTCAAALQLLSQRVDGIYMFNYACHLREHEQWYGCSWSKSDFNKLIAVPREAGTIKTLKNAPRQYTFWKELPIYVEPLRPAKCHQTIKFNILADDLKDKKAAISFRQIAESFPHATRKYRQNPIVKPGIINYYLNGFQIDEKLIKRTNQPAGKIPSGFTLKKHELLGIKLPASKLVNGENSLAFHIPHFPRETDPYVYIYELVVDIF
ncbi:MAG: glycoside hydrolase family 10 protein [Sedimentisphaerales bacterium]